MNPCVTPGWVPVWLLGESLCHPRLTPSWPSVTHANSCTEISHKIFFLFLKIIYKDKNLSRHMEICRLARNLLNSAKYCEIFHLPHQIANAPLNRLISRSFHHFFECHLCSREFEQFPRNQTSCYKSRTDVIKLKPVVIKTDQIIQK